MKRVVYGWWGLLGTMSCWSCAPAAPATEGEQAAPVPVVDMAAAEPSASAVSSAAPVAVAEAEPAPRNKLPPAIPLPDEVACTLAAESTTLRYALRLRPGGSEVAQLRYPPQARLTLPVGPMLQGAVIDASDEVVTVRAAVNGTDVRLHPARAMAMSGYLVPKSGASLSWVEGSRQGGGTLEVALPESGESHVELLRPVRHRVDCAGVGLKLASFTAGAAVPGVSRRDHGKLAATRIELRDKPGGEVVATLDLTTVDQRDAMIYERRGGAVRIGYELWRVLLFGWIPGAQVKPAKPPIPAVSGFGTGSGRGWGGSHFVVVQCDHDVPLLGRADGQLASLGVLGPGTEIRYRPTSEPQVAVRLLKVRWLSAATTQSLAVPTASLTEGCHKPSAAP